MKVEIQEGWDETWTIDDTTPIGDDNDPVADDNDPMALALVKLLGSYSLVQCRVGYQKMTTTIKEKSSDIIASVKTKGLVTMTVKGSRFILASIVRKATALVVSFIRRWHS
jgi:hypothetical protein